MKDKNPAFEQIMGLRHIGANLSEGDGAFRLHRECADVGNRHSLESGGARNSARWPHSAQNAI